jgi:hypothetical protein
MRLRIIRSEKPSDMTDESRWLVHWYLHNTSVNTNGVVADLAFDTGVKPRSSLTNLRLATTSRYPQSLYG